MKDEELNQDSDSLDVSDSESEAPAESEAVQEARADSERPEKSEQAEAKQPEQEQAEAAAKAEEEVSEPEKDESETELDAAEDGEEEQFELDDPLGTAYDLERGAPLEDESSRHRGAGLPWRSKIESAKEFFSTEILYRYDILEVEDREQLRGNYRLELKGYNGGIWTLKLGDDLEVVNRKEDADIVFSMEQMDFLHIVNGNLNPQLAMLSKKMTVSGDIRKAIVFEGILVPSE